MSSPKLTELLHAVLRMLVGALILLDPHSAFDGVD